MFSLCGKTKINTLLMHKVLDEETRNLKYCPKLSVAKRVCVSEGDLAEVIPCVLFKLKAWLSMTDYFCFSMMSPWLIVSNMPHSRSCWLL